MRQSHAYAEDFISSDEGGDSSEDLLSRINPSQRILLIPHCLRTSKTCKASTKAWGVDCVECNPQCQVNLLRRKALDLGYKGVCIAPGGSLALKYIKETGPLGIVAVACQKELEEGIDNVAKLGAVAPVPPIVVIPLTKDGCIDTEVNVGEAFDKISLGCAARS